MPARASRRSGLGAQNPEVLNAIIMKLTDTNPQLYDDMLAEWDRRREAAVAEMQRVDDLHKANLTELASREKALDERCARFEALIAGLPSRMSDAALDGIGGYEHG